MNKFNIQLDEYTSIYMEPSKKVRQIAARLSMFQDEPVIVYMFARARFVAKGGEIIKSNPDLSEFYLDVDPQDQWEWSCLGQDTV